MLVKGSAGRGATAKSYETNYEFGKDLDEAVKLFGKPGVFNSYLAKEIVNVQNIIRNAINAGKKAEEIDALVKAHKPGVKVSRKKSKLEKTLAETKSMNAEDLEATIAAAKAELAKRK